MRAVVTRSEIKDVLDKARQRYVDNRSEASLERTLCRVVGDLGGLCLKMPADLYIGIPDRLILMPDGRMYFVELKKLTGVLTEAQHKYIYRLRKMGYNVVLVKGFTSLTKFIKELKRAEKNPSRNRG